MKKAFSLVEVVMVVAILGILAAIVLPQFKSQSAQAKESSAKDNLRILRNAIQIYAVKHDDVTPGYPSNDPTKTPMLISFNNQLVSGGYLSDIPENPFNGLTTIRVLKNADDFPAAANGVFGWIYKPATQTIKLDYPGTDTEGSSYYDY